MVEKNDTNRLRITLKIERISAQANHFGVKSRTFAKSGPDRTGQKPDNFSENRTVLTKNRTVLTKNRTVQTVVTVQTISQREEGCDPGGGSLRAVQKRFFLLIHRKDRQ